MMSNLTRTASAARGDTGSPPAEALEESAASEHDAGEHESSTSVDGVDSEERSARVSLLRGAPPRVVQATVRSPAKPAVPVTIFITAATEFPPCRPPARVPRPASLCDRVERVRSVCQRVYACVPPSPQPPALQ